MTQRLIFTTKSPDLAGLVCPVIASLREAFSLTTKMLNKESYHPNIGSSLQLCIDSITTKIWVHFQTCWLSQVNVGLQANSCNNMISSDLQGKNKLINNKQLISMNYTESLQKLILHTFLPSFSWISNLLSLNVTDFTKASVITLTPSKTKERSVYYENMIIEIEHLRYVKTVY